MGVRAYLPDYEKDVVKRMNRNFLFYIINKTDTKFFNSAIQLLDAAYSSKESVNRNQTLNINNAGLLTILKSAQNISSTYEDLEGKHTCLNLY